MTKVAVVLFNLGGPDRPESVEPFLFNLFNDRAIIGAPQPMRWALAKLISKRRAPTALAIYAHLGGGSPLLSNTKQQADALEGVLNGGGEDQEYKVFIVLGCVIFGVLFEVPVRTRFRNRLYDLRAIIGFQTL